MSLKDRLREVEAAEARCKQDTAQARASWKGLKANAKALATPWRIVGAGALLGFIAGRRDKPGEDGVGGKFLAATTQALLTAFGAGITAEAGSDIAQAVQAGMSAGGHGKRNEATATPDPDAPTEP